MICVDEFGLVEIKPIHGHAWRPEAHPSRIRATYNRYHGVRHYISAFDLQANRLTMRCYRRKRWQEFLSFLKQLRARYPAVIRLHVVLDNFSPIAATRSSTGRANTTCVSCSPRRTHRGSTASSRSSEGSDTSL